MYRWLLCFRYLRTRYIALASIISVTLGVATLVIVNSVMSGFAAEMHDRLHGLAGDIVIDCHATGGLPDPEGHLAEIKRICGDEIIGSSVSVSVPAMLGIEFRGQQIGRHVNMIGLDPETYNSVSDFGKYLMHPENQQNATFDLRDGGYAPGREELADAGWKHRRHWVHVKRLQDKIRAQEEALKPQAPQSQEAIDAAQGPTFGAALSPSFAAADAPPVIPNPLSDDSTGTLQATLDPMEDQFPGIILGISTCSVRARDADGNVIDHFYAQPGDDVRLMFLILSKINSSVRTTPIPRGEL